MHDAVVLKLIAASRGCPCDSMASCVTDCHPLLVIFVAVSDSYPLTRMSVVLMTVDRQDDRLIPLSCSQLASAYVRSINKDSLNDCNFPVYWMRTRQGGLILSDVNFASMRKKRNATASIAMRNSESYFLAKNVLQ